MDFEIHKDKGSREIWGNGVEERLLNTKTHTQLFHPASCPRTSWGIWPTKIQLKSDSESQLEGITLLSPIELLTINQEGSQMVALELCLSWREAVSPLKISDLDSEESIMEKNKHRQTSFLRQVWRITRWRTPEHHYHQNYREGLQIQANPATPPPHTHTHTHTNFD